MQKQYESAHTYRKTVLDNGIRVVTEEVPYLKSFSLGIWVRSGSRYEPPEVNGISHFIEHMLFKGTERRSAFDIAKEIDSVGGVLNAFTSKEFTAYYCKAIDENWDTAADLLCDIFLNPSFPDEEIEREKLVVCQEIHQTEDTPEELVHELLGIRIWRNNALGQPILGTVSNISGLDRDTLLDFKRQAYSPSETIVAAAGKINHDQIVELMERTLGRLSVSSSAEQPTKPQVKSSWEVVNRDLEQVHVCLGAEAPSALDDRRYAGYLLNAILGGGMSSRLFQEVREKNGLAYSVYSFLSSFSDTGVIGVYAGCDSARLEEVVRIINRESMALASSVTDDDLHTAKNHIKGSLVLAMESSEALMNRLAKGEFYFGRYVSLHEIIASLDQVTRDELADVCHAVINSGQFNLVALGPVQEDGDLFQIFDP